MVVTLREWQRIYSEGGFSAKDEDTQRSAGWVDWHCKADSLASRTKKLASVVTRLRDGGKVSLDSSYVTFKNTQPEGAKPYDMLVISSANAILYVCTLDDERVGDGKKWHVYDYVSTDGSSPYASFYTVVQLAKWLNEPPTDSKSSTFTTRNVANPALLEDAVADAREKFGIGMEFTGIRKKYFGDYAQALAWLNERLPYAERGLLLVAMYGGGAVVGYTVG